MNHLMPTRFVIADRPRPSARRMPASTPLDRSMQAALALPLLNRDVVLQRLAGEPHSALQAIALMHLLRTHAAELQRAAEELAEVTQAERTPSHSLLIPLPCATHTLRS